MERLERLPGARHRLRKGLQGVRMFARRSPVATAWGVIVLLLILLALAAPVVAPKHPLELDFDRIRVPPDSENLLGTDDIGRDILSRAIYGSRVSLFVALISVLLGTSVGAVWGIASGYVGGKLDLVSERLVEIIMAIPGLILAFVLVLVLGASMWTVIVAIAAGRLPYGSRVIRSVVLSVKETPYVDAAKAVGASSLRIMTFHVAPLILAFVLVLVLGASMWTVIVAIAAGRLPYGSRVIRSVVLSVKETPYVDAAKAVGASSLRIMTFHVAPQCFAPYLVLATVHLGTAIVIEASLSFLGLGVRPPTPTWGGMLGEASTLLVPHWWMVVFPGIFITVAVLSFNLFGDGLRDALDPRLRGTR